jgi:hypothetical protein
MNILYNPSVVKFAEGYENKGIDFAGYTTASSGWVLEGFPCFSGTPVCVWYDRTGSQANKIEYTYNSQKSNPYAFIRFECGAVTGAATARAICTHF